MSSVELKTQKLNSLKIKEAMWITAGYECPQHIKKEIELLTNDLNNIDFIKESNSTKDIVEKGGSEIPILTTNHKN
jgi:hypothetical protein